MAALVARIHKFYGYWDLLEVTDLTGRVVTATPSSEGYDPSREEWFRTVAGGEPVVVSAVDRGGEIRWILASPVLDLSGRPAGVVAGDLDERLLAKLLAPDVVGRGSKARRQ